MSDNLYNMGGAKVTASPIYRRVSIDFPCEQYSEKVVEDLASWLNKILTENKVFHTEPEIIDIYEHTYINQGNSG